MPVYEYEVVFQDKNGFQTSKRYESVDLTDFAAARAAADALITDIQALTDAAVLKDRLTEVVFFASAAGPNSNVYERVDATLDLTVPGKKANHKFPSPIATIFTGNTLILDATAWEDYVENFISGGDWTVSDGEQLDAAAPTVTGRRVFTRGG